MGQGQRPAVARRTVSIGIRSFIVLVAVCAAAVPVPPAWVERLYSQGLYLFLQRALTSASNLVPVSLLDISVGLLIGLLAIRWGRRLAEPRRLRAARTIAADVVVVAAGVYLIFLLLWGLNYRREPLTARYDFDPARVTAERIRALAELTVAELNALYDPARPGPWPDVGAVPDGLAHAFTQAQRDMGMTRTALPAVPKPSLLEIYFRHSAIDGMTDPFFLSVILYRGMFPFERPFVLAHEWAHLAGHADEAEANFLGWLTCMRADAAARYSGWLYLYYHVMRALPPGDRAQAASRLDPGPRRDLAAIAERYAQGTPVVRRAARHLYERFLQAHRVDEGLASYHGIVALIIGLEGVIPSDPPSAPALAE